MNQKRITNQILKQQNYTLNSTLNYLFNISNMKKLFSYLLISSMVVLSSCTNYDDQFDDLNAQINTLKSQIEGFSSLSSGLTALQGTVASLQSAINNIPVTPATDISGLESSLETLAASVAELQTALANAATAAEVAALQTALDAQQADLTELLNQNNIYAPTSGTLTVSTQSELDFALALGDKVSIINGGVNITHTTSMNDANVATLMGKMVSVTGTVTYTATASSTTAGVFSKLNGALNITLDQTGDISLPEFKTVGSLTLNGDDETTSVSLPMLTKATGLSFSDITKATTFSMPTLVAYDGDITITIANAGSVDLSAFTNDTNADGTADSTPDALTVNAASLTAPVYAAGTITADRLTSVDLPKWKFDNSSSFDRATTVVLPSVNNGKNTAYSININTIFPKATSVHLIAAASTKSTPDHLDVTTGTSNNLNTLILGGTWDNVNVDGTDMTSLTFDGTAKDVTVTNSDITELDIPYTSAAKGSLTITSNLDLTSVTASKVDGLKGLTITGNTELETVSFDALDSAAAEATVNISGNDFAGTVTYTNSGATTGTFASTSGLKEMKAFLDSAISGRKTSVEMTVELDDATAISSTGVESTPDPYYLVSLDDAVTTGGDDAVAYQLAVEVDPDGSETVQVTIDGDNLFVNNAGGAAPITPSDNMALAVTELKSSAAVTRAAALGIVYDVVSGSSPAALTVSFTAALNSATGETTLSTTSATAIASDDYATLTIGSDSVTSTFASGYSGTATSTVGIASGLAAAWTAKYGSNSSLFSLNADTNSGKIAISVNAASGNRAHGSEVSISYSTGTSTATTPLLDYVIGATNSTSDNKLLGEKVIMLFKDDTEGVTGVTFPTVVVVTGASSSTLTSTLDYSTASTILGNSAAAGDVFPDEARGLAIPAYDGTDLVITTAAKTTDRTAFL